MKVDFPVDRRAFARVLQASVFPAPVGSSPTTTRFPAAKAAAARSRKYLCWGRGLLPGVKDARSCSALKGQGFSSFFPAAADAAFVTTDSSFFFPPAAAFLRATAGASSRAAEPSRPVVHPRDRREVCGHQ